MVYFFLMVRFALLILLSVLWILPPFPGGDDLIALEVVGGVEAAPEPEGSGAEEKDEAEKWPLSAGDSILVDLELNPEEEGFEDKAASLFLEQEKLEQVMEKITCKGLPVICNELL